MELQTFTPKTIQKDSAMPKGVFINYFKTLEVNQEAGRVSVQDNYTTVCEIDIVEQEVLEVLEDVYFNDKNYQLTESQQDLIVNKAYDESFEVGEAYDDAEHGIYGHGY